MKDLFIYFDDRPSFFDDGLIAYHKYSEIHNYCNTEYLERLDSSTTLESYILYDIPRAGSRYQDEEYISHKSNPIKTTIVDMGCPVGEIPEWYP